MQKSPEAEQYISAAPEPQKEILNTLRNLIAEAVPGVTEEFKWSQPVYTTEKSFCYLKFTKKHVNLGFFNFEKIDDPENKLEGTGKQMRHIKIHKPADINYDLLRNMISQAAKL